jgi:hypothetical protein
MDGGSCESTAYIAYGYKASGICLPLANYHNMDDGRGKIAPESISVSDWRNMATWFEALVMDEEGYGGGPTPLLDDLEKRFAQQAPLLNGSGKKSRGKS